MADLGAEAPTFTRDENIRGIGTLPSDRDAKREMLLGRVEQIGKTLQESGAKSEELATLAPEAVQALRFSGLFTLKLPMAVGGIEADPVTEMLVLERICLS